MELDFNEALKVLDKEHEEEKNWRSARARIGEVLRAARDAQKIILEADGRKAVAQADVDRLAKEKAALEHSIKVLPVEVDAAKKVLLATRAQVEAARQELAELEVKVTEAKAIIAKGESASKVLASLAE